MAQWVKDQVLLPLFMVRVQCLAQEFPYVMGAAKKKKKERKKEK